MINWKRVKELEQDIGADEFGEVIELFLDEVEALIGPMREGKASINIGGDLHFLKGSALTVGFRALGQMCSDGEKLASNNSETDINIGEILATYDASKIEFLAGTSSGLAR